MAFLEKRFPLQTPVGAGGTIIMRDERVMLRSGYVKINKLWAQDLRTWDIRRWVRTADDFALLRSFFLAAYDVDGFRFRDLSDYTATDAGNTEYPSCASITGSTTTFHLQKTYASYGQTYQKKIIKPVEGTVKIYVSGIRQTTASIDHTTGIVTLLTTPSETPTANFEFDKPVIFDFDSLPSNWENYQVLSTALSLREVRI